MNANLIKYINAINEPIALKNDYINRLIVHAAVNEDLVYSEFLYHFLLTTGTISSKRWLENWNAYETFEDALADAEEYMREHLPIRCDRVKGH